MEAMADDGAVSGKTWLAIINKVTRHTHVEANEQTVPVKADFTAGGAAKRPIRGTGGCRQRSG